MRKQNTLDHTVYPNKDRGGQTFGSRKETLNEMLVKRNNLLIGFFRKAEVEVELYGKAEAPMIVIDRKYKLSAYVHNFNFYLTSKPTGNSAIVKEIKINQTNAISKEELEEHVSKYAQEDWSEVVSRLFGKKYKMEELYDDDKKSDT